ncbi:MAG: hypothetical protein R6X34_15605 [Chloroflexota bacterium]
MQPTAVWQTRWQALSTTLDEMIQAYQGLAEPTFGAVTTCLKAFGGDQFQFFLDGFSNVRLLPSPDFPPDNIYRATLDQISYDITAVQQAVDQRQDGFPTMHKALKTADALSQNALNLGIRSDLIKAAAVITYFLKAPNIRVIPYAPAAVVGIPFTCLTTPQDYLAIPHEIGHYLYHHGYGLASALQNLLPAMPAWGSGWLEEIFADVYGCLVAGPVIGLDFQDLLSDNDRQRFTTGDGDHPVDAIRPFIYTAVLQEMGFVNAAPALDQRWLAVLQSRGNPQSITPGPEFGDISLKEGETFVRETAVTILNYLRDHYHIPETAAWTGDLASPHTNPEQLYQMFAQNLDQLAQTKLNRLEIAAKENKVLVVLPNGARRNQRLIGHTHTWRDWAKAQSRQHPKDQLPPALWIEIFTAGGWPVKGPEGGGGQGSP